MGAFSLPAGLRKIAGAAALGLVLSCAALCQSPPCVTAERLKSLTDDLKAGKIGQPDQALLDQIVKLSAPAPVDPQGHENVPPEQKAAATARVCEILNTKPWPGKTEVTPQGSDLWISLIRSALDLATQRELVPVIAAAVDKKETDQDAALASLIDHIRLRSGQAQLFGTTAVANKGFLVLWPIQAEESVDVRRKQYGMGPLRDYLLQLQYTFKMPLIRSTSRPAYSGPAADADKPGTSASGLVGDTGDQDIVKVDTSLVRVDATVFGTNVPDLTKDDFKVYEDDQPQNITLFSAPESPFDIVLLLDLSGSTENKVGLIKKTTKDLIEMKRDTDRIAVVTFSSGETVVSPLEADKAKLLKSVSNVKDRGGSNVWDAEKFAIDLLKKNSAKERRKAVIVMTDGVDGFLTSYAPGFGSETLFADLVEEVRNSQVAIFPIYLDTEHDAYGTRQAYESARQTLQLLADESGGNYYAAKDVGNLNEIYARIMKDVGRVYTLGYEPVNGKHDGRWRSIRVEIPSHPELKVRARSGYYAR